LRPLVERFGVTLLEIPVFDAVYGMGAHFLIWHMITLAFGARQHSVDAIAPAYEGPRNELNNKAHEPTSGRSTHYWSGHLSRAFRDIGRIFSSLGPVSSTVLFRSCFALSQIFVHRCRGGWPREPASSGPELCFELKAV
jgi:hypothetical protein